MQLHSVTRPLTRADVRLSALLAVAVFLIGAAFLAPAPSSIDGASMLAVSESLVRQEGFTVPAFMGAPGRDGQHYSRWYPLLSIVAMPTTWVGHLAAKAASLPPHYVAGASGMVLSAAIAAVCAALVMLLVLRMGGSARPAVFAAAAFAFGTIAFAYSRDFFAEPLLALLTAAAALAAFGRSRSGVFLALIASALCVLAKPTGIVVGPLLSLYLLARKEKLSTAVQPGAGALAGLLLYFAYNFYRFGNQLEFGQPSSFALPGFGEAVLGLLVSPGRGLLLYCPVVLALAGLARPLWSRLESLLLVSLALGYLVLHATWTHWEGGWCWGPRFLLPALPGLLALTAFLTARAWRRAFVFLAIAGFVINAPMLVSSFKRYHAEAQAAGITREQFLWSLADSPLVNAWGAADRQIREAAATDVRAVIGNAGVQERSGMAQNQLRVVTIWWWMLPAAGIPRWIGVVAAALLVAAGLWVLGRGWALAARHEDLVLEPTVAGG